MSLDEQLPMTTRHIGLCLSQDFLENRAWSKSWCTNAFLASAIPGRQERGHTRKWGGEGGRAKTVRCISELACFITSAGGRWVCETSSERLCELLHLRIGHHGRIQRNLSAGPCLALSLVAPRDIGIPVSGAVAFAECGTTRKAGEWASRSQYPPPVRLQPTASWAGPAFSPASTAPGKSGAGSRSQEAGACQVKLCVT